MSIEQQLRVFAAKGLAAQSAVDAELRRPEIKRRIKRELVKRMARSCRQCGCTETKACHDEITGTPCYWVESDLCSACAVDQVNRRLVKELFSTTFGNLERRLRKANRFTVLACLVRETQRHRSLGPGWDRLEKMLTQRLQEIDAASMLEAL